MSAAALLPHHDGSPLHVSTSTPALGDTVQVRVRVPRAWGELRAVRVRSNPDHEPRWSEAVLTGTTSDADGASWDWWQADVVAETVPTIDRGFGAVIEATVAASRLGVPAYDQEALRERYAGDDEE